MIANFWFSDTGYKRTVTKVRQYRHIENYRYGPVKKFIDFHHSPNSNITHTIRPSQQQHDLVVVPLLFTPPTVDLQSLSFLNIMSRSALWRQEVNIQEREKQAQDLFLQAIEEGKVRVNARCHYLICGGLFWNDDDSHWNMPGCARFNSPLVSHVWKQNNRTKNLVPLWGNLNTFNLNSVLLQNITKSPYFYKKCLQELSDWTSVVDEIYYEVKHLEPWNGGKKHRTVRFLWTQDPRVLVWLSSLVRRYVTFCAGPCSESHIGREGVKRGKPGSKSQSQYF